MVIKSQHDTHKEAREWVLNETKRMRFQNLHVTKIDTKERPNGRIETSIYYFI